VKGKFGPREPGPPKPPKETRDKKSWARVSNCPGGPGTQPGNKYDFSTHLRKVGDFVETYAFPTQHEAWKVAWAAHIWAYRKHCRVKCWLIYYPDGYGMHVEVSSHTRRKPKNV